MKKYLILTIAILISTLGFSQKKTEVPVNITKAKLAEAKVVSDLVKDLPKDTKSITVEIAAKHEDKLIQATSNSEILTAEEKNVLKNADINSKLYIDIKYTDPKDKKIKLITVGLKVIE